MRTSQTDPLRIDELNCRPHAPGTLGLTICPGKRGGSVYGAAWSRDLSEDLAVIAGWQPAMVFTLVESHELRSLGVPQLGDAMHRLGLAWHHLPIPDLQPPGNGFMKTAREPMRGALAALRGGRKVLVHCRGGLGRAGTIAASLLIELGEEPRTALRRVRDARPGAIETAAQERFLHGYRCWLGN